MKSLLDLTLHSLEVVFRKWKEPSTGYTQEVLVKQIREFQQYCAIAAPVLPMLAEHCFSNKYGNGSIYVFFLPFFVRNKKIEIVENCGSLIKKLVTNSDLFETEILAKVTVIRFVYEEFINDESFVKKFPRLEVLVLNMPLDDDFVGAIVRHFPELRVLECWPHNVTVTDRGLEKLANLKKLKFVHLGNRDYCGGCYTATGVAKLMKALPELETFVCLGFIMKEALQILKLSQTTFSTVKSIDLEGVDVLANTVVTANEVCPSLERICVTVHEEEKSQFLEALSSFMNIKELHLCVTGKFSTFDGIGEKLSVLKVNQDHFEFQNLIVMGTHCPNLAALTLIGEQLNASSSDVERRDNIRSSLFPSLDTLVYEITDTRGVYLFMHKDSGLLHFHYTIIPLYSNRILEDVLERLQPDCGLWPHLNTLVINYVRYDQALVTRVAEALPSLERIIMDVTPAEDGLTYVTSRGKRVTVSD